MTFNKVNFSYDEDTPVLKDVSFNIPPGEKLAIVGPTGSEKSTLIRLLSRFYDFDDNLIHLDGIDLNKILSKDLRSRVEWCSRICIFFRFYPRQPDPRKPQSPEEKAILAAKTVNAHPFIEGLEDDINRSYRKGVKPSQGQRQLLALKSTTPTQKFWY